MEILTRLDGRLYNSLRPQKLHLNPLKTPSCKITVGNLKNDKKFTAIGNRTSVLATILTSTDNKGKNNVMCQYKPYFEVFIRPSIGMIKSSIRSMEAIIVKVVQSLVKSEKLGKITLSIRIQIIEDAGSLLSVCLNAIITCLYLSGIEINNIPYAVTFGVIQKNNTELVILDPTNDEIKLYCTTSVTLLCDPITGTISLTTIDSGSGGYSSSTLQTMINIANKVSPFCLDELNKYKDQLLNPSKVTFETNNYD